MRLFKNRLQAANELAQHLAFLKPDQPLVLGLANGGVPIAEVVARQLDASLDVVLIEKLFAPGSPTQVVGAVDEHGRISLIQSTARWHHVTSQQLVEPARTAFRELQRRRAALRSVLPECDVRGKTIVIVGQGVATGAKMLGAIASVKDRGASKVIAAAPAGTSHATWQLHEATDMVVIPHRPAKFKGIEHFYEEFNDVSDEVVLAIAQQWMAERPQPQGVKTIPMKLQASAGHALMCEVDLPPGCTRGSGPYPAVLFAHDHESNARSPRNVMISQRLAKRNIVGVRLDFTAHGRSEGAPQQATDAQLLADLHVAFLSTAALAEVDGQRMGLIGSGTGAMIALHYAAQVPGVKSLVIRGPVCGRETEVARHITAPTLVIHGEADTALDDAVRTLDRELAAQHQVLRIPSSNRLFNDPVSMEMMVAATVDWLTDHLLAAAPVGAPPEVTISSPSTEPAETS